MEPATKEALTLVVKTILLLIGGLLAIAALVELRVGGSSPRAWGALAIGLLLCGPPLGLAFRDALRTARKGGAR